MSNCRRRFSTRFARGIVILWIASLMAGCGAYFSEYGVGTSDRDIQIIDYVALRSLLAGDSGNVVLVDVRPSAKAFATEHIEGAVHIPLPQLRSSHPALGEASTVVVYGRSGDDLSAVAAKKLMKTANRLIFDFRGGLGRWKASGGKTIKAAAPTTNE